MAISRPGLIEPYGTWFTKGGTKSGGIKGKLLGGRVYLHENIRTVQLPKALKERIYRRVRDTGEFWGEDYDAVLALAKEQSKRYGEPIAVPSPKRATGDWKPENEAFLVFEGDVAKRITGTRFAGLSTRGTIVKRISVGQQAPVTQTRLGSIGENLRYNWDLGREGGRIYNRRYLEAQARDMARKKSELYDGGLSYPGEYGGHGLDHSMGVMKGQMTQWSASPTLQRLVNPEEMWMRAKYHDIAKIGDTDTQPYPHGWVAGTAIRKGMISDPELLALPKKTQMAIGRDIQLHTDIQPTLRSQIRHRPSPTAKALATADRLDLTRFGTPVKASKLFPIPEDAPKYSVKRVVSEVADNLPIGFRVINVRPEEAFWHDTPFEQIRRGIREGGNEQGYLLDARTGDIVWSGEGTQHSVDIPSPGTGLGHLRDIHTHPQGKIYDPMFSPQDMGIASVVSRETGSVVLSPDSSAHIRFKRPVDLAEVVGLKGKNPSPSELAEGVKKLGERMVKEEAEKIQLDLAAEWAVKHPHLTAQDIMKILNSQSEPIARAALFKAADRLSELVGADIYVAEGFNQLRVGAPSLQGPLSNRAPSKGGVARVGPPEVQGMSVAGARSPEVPGMRTREPPQVLAPPPAAPKGGERLDYSYRDSGKPAPKPTPLPPAKEYGYPYAAPYGQKYPPYKEPYATQYGTQYLEQ
ncbi:MAG: HD domain-containing protein, partial [Bacilli bacterium]